MTKETKGNLIFGLILIAILTPGAILLFRKKLDPAAQPMYLPDAVQHQAPYMDWVQGNPSIRRVIPPQTAQWVQQLTTQKWLDPQTPTPHRQQTQISENRRFEILAIQQPSPHHWRLSLLLWDPHSLPEDTRWQMGDQVLHVQYREPVDLPRHIHRELRDLGFVRPPHTVTYLQLNLPSPASPESGGGREGAAPGSAPGVSKVQSPKSNVLGDAPDISPGATSGIPGIPGKLKLPRGAASQSTTLDLGHGTLDSSAPATPPPLQAWRNDQPVDRWTWESADYPAEPPATGPAPSNP